MSDKILTVLIPTYDRLLPLQKLLNSFVENRLNLDIEILVAINASSDGSDVVCKAYEKNIPNLKTIYFTEFLCSAEENISRSFQYCSGKYVFILGDDDNLFFDVFNIMTSILRGCDAPALIFNNISSSGKTVSFSDIMKPDSYVGADMIKASEKKIFYCKYNELVEGLGIITTMAFISRYIIRKDLLRDFSNYINISRIYSHVFAFLDFLNREKVMIVDLPLTSRGDSVVKERFNNIAKTLSQPVYFNWHHGLLMQLDNAVKNNFITPSCFFLVKEYKEDGSQFYLWKHTLYMILAQLMSFLDYFKEEEILKKECVDLLKNFDNRVLSEKDRIVFDYIVSALYFSISRITKDNFKKKEGKFAAWQARRLIDLLHSEYEIKNVSFIRKFMLNFRKTFYSSIIKILELKLLPSFLYPSSRKKLHKLELKLMFSKNLS